jgi:hypothetical protein
MTTLHFAGSDYKIFTPIPSAMREFSNGTPSTMIVLMKKTVTGGTDYCGVTGASGTGGPWYHTLSNDTTTPNLYDDDGVGTSSATASSFTDDTINWYLVGGDADGASGSAGNFHQRNQSSLGAWVNTVGSAHGSLNGSAGASAWLHIGHVGDESGGQKDIAVVAIWAGIRFANSDYGLWTKTSDLWNHPQGHPTFLCECTATTLVDLAGGSTYSAANSSGTALTGADPANWTMDGIGSASIAFPSIPQPLLMKLGLYMGGPPISAQLLPNFEPVVLDQNVSPTGIASAEAFGAPRLDQEVSPTGIASAEAFGVPRIDQVVNPTGIASAEAFGTPRVDQTVNPTGISSAEAFGITSLQFDQTVSPTGIASAEAFGTPTINVVGGNQDVNPTGIASAEAFGTPTVNVTVNAAGIVSAEAFGSPAITTVVSISPSGIASLEAFGAPRLDQFVSPTGIPSAEAFGLLPTFNQTVNPVGIVSGEAFGSPTMVGGDTGPSFITRLPLTGAGR